MADEAQNGLHARPFAIQSANAWDRRDLLHCPTASSPPVQLGPYRPASTRLVSFHSQLESILLGSDGIEGRSSSMSLIGRVARMTGVYGFLKEHYVQRILVPFVTEGQIFLE